MRKKEIILWLAAALVIGGIVAMFASSSPDGLEWVAETKGFIHLGERPPLLESPIPDYAWPSIHNEKLATSLAGVAGTLLLFCLGLGVAFLLRSGKPLSIRQKSLSELPLKKW